MALIDGLDAAVAKLNRNKSMDRDYHQPEPKGFFLWSRDDQEIPRELPVGIDIPTAIVVRNGLRSVPSREAADFPIFHRVRDIVNDSFGHNVGANA